MNLKGNAILWIAIAFIAVLTLGYGAVYYFDNTNSQTYHYSAERLNNGTILISNNENYYPMGMVSINITTSPNPVSGCIPRGVSIDLVIPDTHVCQMRPVVVYDPVDKGSSVWVFGENNNSYEGLTEVTLVGNYINGTSRVIHTFIL